MVAETAARQKSLFERLQDESQKYGIGIVRLAVNKLGTDVQRREFFGQYVTFLTLGNPGTLEEVRKQARALILRAIPVDNYHEYEGWSRAMSPNDPPLGPEISGPPQVRQSRRPRQPRG